MIRIGYRLYGVVICIIYLMKLYDMAPVLASYGDQLPQYRGCIRSCLPRRPCLNQSIWMSLLGWDDHAECSYRLVERERERVFCCIGCYTIPTKFMCVCMTTMLKIENVLIPPNQMLPEGACTRYRLSELHQGFQ